MAEVLKQTIDHGDSTPFKDGVTGWILPVWADWGAGVKVTIVLNRTIEQLGDKLIVIQRWYDGTVAKKNCVIPWDTMGVEEQGGHIIFRGVLRALSPYEKTQPVREVNPPPSGSRGPLGAETKQAAQMAANIIGCGVEQGMAQHVTEQQELAALLTQHIGTVRQQLEATLEVHQQSFERIIGELQGQRLEDRQLFQLQLEASEKKRLAIAAQLEQAQASLEEREQTLLDILHGFKERGKVNTQQVQEQIALLREQTQALTEMQKGIFQETDIQFTMLVEILSQTLDIENVELESDLVEALKDLITKGVTNIRIKDIGNIYPRIETLLQQTVDEYKRLYNLLQDSNLADRQNLEQQLEAINKRGTALRAMQIYFMNLFTAIEKGNG